MSIRADLHIHSCLSPCGSLEMSPRAIVKRALEEGLGVIALTDHNSARNCPTLNLLCSRESSLKCLFGMEVTTSEEYHCLCLFDSLEKALLLDAWVYKSLPDVRQDPAIYGDQVYVDENDVIMGEVKKSLSSATDISGGHLAEWVHSRGGLVIPSHVERPYYSLTSQLGFIPDEDFDALEVSRAAWKDGNFDAGKKLPLITASDAHYPADIASGCIELEMDLNGFSISALKSALKEGRYRNLIRDHKS